MSLTGKTLAHMWPNIGAEKKSRFHVPKPWPHCHFVKLPTKNWALFWGWNDHIWWPVQRKTIKPMELRRKLGKKHEINWKMPSDTGSTNIKRATPPLSITHPAGWMTIVWNIHNTQQTGDGTWNLVSQLNVLGYGPCCGSKSTVFVAAASIFVSFVNGLGIHSWGL